MKNYRLNAFFLAVALVLSLCAVPAAAQRGPTAEASPSPSQSADPGASASPAPTEEPATLADPSPQHCRAAIVVDDYGDILYSYHGEEKMYPASITKIMTSLLAMEALASGKLTLSQPITVSETAATLPEGSSTAGIKAGEILTVEELLYCDLLASANEACNILAEAVAGSIPAFVDMMNQKARELGMTGTHFMNPHGLHDEEHYTTAYDITTMARAAMEFETFRTIVSTATHTVPATNLAEERVLHNTNYLLKNPIKPYYTYDKAIGIKTGSTTPAGQCLASAATDPSTGRTYYCAVLGAETAENDEGIKVRFSFTESKRLLEWAFQNFRRATLLDSESSEAIREVPVTLSDEGDYVTVQPVGSLEATIPKIYDPRQAELKMELAESVEAPVEQGQKLGTVTLVYNGKVYGTLDMAASFDVSRSDFQYYVKVVQDYLAKWWVKALIAAGVVLILFLVVLFGVILPRRKRRRRYGRVGAHSGRGNYRGGR